MANNFPYLGTDLKYRLAIEAEGFSMVSDYFNVVITNGVNSIKITKDDCATDGQGNYYIMFNSSDLGPGVVKAIITAYVPDNDFPDSFREEVFVIERLTKILDV